MKKHHFILASSLVFILLFCNEDIGINLSLFGLVLTALIAYFFKDRFVDRSYYVLTFASVLSCMAFAWYGDFVSVLAMALSVLLLQFKTQNASLKIIQVFPIVFINAFASSVRIFQFSQWLPKTKLTTDFTKKLIAYFIIPALFLSLFFTVYSFGSDHFSSLLMGYSLDVNPYQLIFVTVFGFYFSFSFWNYWVPEICEEINPKLGDSFNDAIRSNNQKTFSFLDLDFRRKSGEITLGLLNVLLLVFIATYNYEQFFETTNSSELSSAIHERVNAVIFSTLMSIGVILLYFKGEFNFDAKANKIKNLAKIWIVLNAILIVSTCIKNAEYVSFFGLTYKRLGVFAFLILSMISLVFTFLKITRQKTNAYLFNQMVWYCYGVILLCSFVNWGNLITTYNISVNKGVEPLFLSQLNFNDAARRQFFLENKLDGKTIERQREEEISLRQKNSFLSKALYYELIQTK